MPRYGIRMQVGTSNLHEVGWVECDVFTPSEDFFGLIAACLRETASEFDRIAQEKGSFEKWEQQLDGGI